MDSPVAIFGYNDEDNVDVTCLTWVNVNRIALGHSDGSVTLWSIISMQVDSTNHAAFYVHTGHLLGISVISKPHLHSPGRRLHHVDGSGAA